MVQTVFIRYATPADAEVIARISRQTFYDTFAVHNSKENMDKFMNAQFTMDVLMKEVSEAGNIFMLACEGDNTLGYMRIRESGKTMELGDVDAMELVRIYVTKDSIGKGVGNLLMQTCIDLAIKKEKEILWLGVWEHNQRAIDFYLRNGFEKFSEHVFMLGDDAQTDWMMKKKLK